MEDFCSNMKIKAPMGWRPGKYPPEDYMGFLMGSYNKILEMCVLRKDGTGVIHLLGAANSPKARRLHNKSIRSRINSRAKALAKIKRDKGFEVVIKAEENLITQRTYNLIWSRTRSRSQTVMVFPGYVRFVKDSYRQYRVDTSPDLYHMLRERRMRVLKREISQFEDYLV